MSGSASGRVFISYRREESSAIAGRLYDRLTPHLGDDQVFMDVDTIAPGDDFAEVITQAVSTCDVLLAVIGPGWLTATDRAGRRRLDNPDDLVRLEIQAALERDIRVIPILVEGAVMPALQKLPEGLVGLARRNALSVRHESFGSDADRLLAAIQRILRAKAATPASTGPPKVATPASSRPDVANLQGGNAASARRDLLAGKPESVRQVARIHAGKEVVALTLSPTGHWVAAATKPPGNASLSGDQARLATHVWDVDRGQEVERLPCGVFAGGRLEFSPDGRWLALRDGLLGSVEVWDIAARKRLMLVHVSDLRAQLNDRALAFSQDGNHIATSDGTGVGIWNVLNGEKVESVPYTMDSLASGYKAAAKVVAFGPDDESLAMAVGGSIRVYDLPSHSEDMNFTHREPVTALVYSPTGDWLAAAGERNAQVWEVQTEQMQASCTTEEPLADIAFSRDGHQLVTLTVKRSRGLVAQVWNIEVDAQDHRAAFSKRIDLRLGRSRRTVFVHRHRTRAAALSGDGSRLALVDYDDILHIWDIGDIY